MASRQLAIKTGVVNRLVKEVASYKVESDKQAEVVGKMEAANEDVYEIRQQKRVLGDSLMMIPDSEKRLAKALGELEELIEGQEGLEGTDELANARLALEGARL